MPLWLNAATMFHITRTVVVENTICIASERWRVYLHSKIHKSLFAQSTNVFMTASVSSSLSTTVASPSTSILALRAVAAILPCNSLTYT